MNWQLQEAKSKFSKVVNLAIQEGPQIITRHGEEVVVIVSMDTYRQISTNKPSLLKLLANSPFAGSQIAIERDKDSISRELEL